LRGADTKEGVGERILASPLRPPPSMMGTKIFKVQTLYLERYRSAQSQWPNHINPLLQSHQVTSTLHGPANKLYSTFQSKQRKPCHDGNFPLLGVSVQEYPRYFPGVSTVNHIIVAYLKQIIIACAGHILCDSYSLL
jgi:hypothetical protein